MNSVRVAVLIHSDCTGMGSTEEYLQSRRLPSIVRRLHRGEALPQLEQFDLLVVCGGGMNCDQHDKYPWLIEEKELIRRAIYAKKAYVGLCLGAQLLARAMGAEVRQQGYMEAGWTDVEWLETCQSVRVFQWHEDTFELPAGAQLLARNLACPRQAYRLNPYTIAFQFHPETDAAWIDRLAQDVDQPTPGPYVQPLDIYLREKPEVNKLKSFYFSQLDQVIEAWQSQVT